MNQNYTIFIMESTELIYCR